MNPSESVGSEVFSTALIEWIVALSPILVALVGGFIAVLVKRLERRNDHQHAENHAVLSDIRDSVNHLTDRFDGHLEWHAEKE